VPEFLHQASDDQLALAICFGAVAVSGLIMHFSYNVGRWTGRIRLHETPGHSQVTIADVQPIEPRIPAEPARRDKAA